MRVLLFTLFFCVSAFAQSPIENYLPLKNDKAPKDATRVFEQLSKAADDDAKEAAIDEVLPDTNTRRFVDYVLSDRGLDFGAIESFRLNKLLGSSPGGSGTTTLVSKPAVPAVIGAGIEYGSIVQQTNGAVVTLRGNLLGLARFARGYRQFQYCPEIDQQSCDSVARQFRRVSASVALENIQERQSSGEVSSVSGSAVADLFGGEFRMSSWGLRFDVTSSNNLDDPKFLTAWKAQVDKLRNDPAAAALLDAAVNLIKRPIMDDWNDAATKALKSARSAAEFQRILETQLKALIAIAISNDPTFLEKAEGARRAYSNYFAVRDDLIREAQTHKFSLEYTNSHPQNEPNRSNIRLIYSHQPTLAPVVVTVNLGATFYHHRESVMNRGVFRDLQVAGQIDSRVGQIKDIGPVVLTFAGYYQWMRDDAVLTIGPGNTAPGSGILLPGTAVSLLGTKGHIGIAQAKLSIPLGENLKVPFSMTWSNRTELIKEKDIRGQVGMTLDLDSLFH